MCQSSNAIDEMIKGRVHESVMGVSDKCVCDQRDGCQ